MGLADSHGPASSETPPPPRWRVDGPDIPLESLETGPLPDGTRPDDIKTLQDLVRSLARELRLTRERLEQELKHRYGRHSEKRPGGNGKGPDGKPGDGSTTAPGSTAGGSDTGTSSDDSGTKKPGHGRRPIPPDLPRKDVDIPSGDGRCKECGGPAHHLEYVESYRFDYVPGYIRVVVLRRSRRVCDDTTCTSPFAIAKLPPEPIPKGRATAGFLAHLLVTKFADHCPLYRFRKILLRQKVDLPLSTLVDYCRKSTELLKPLWEVMRQRVLLSEILQTDDTHVQVRLPRKKGVLKGHLWVYKGDDTHPYVVFAFTPNWEGSGPQDFLKEFKGYIQADAFKGYDKLFTDPRRIEVGCMAHSRRKWVTAKSSSPVVADSALDMIGELYAIEKAAKDLTPDQRRTMRQERSAPILEKLRVWMEEQRGRVLPKSPVAVAIEYARNQWVALTRYLEDGRLKIDNNAAELELRGVALGRKNWMAIGSEVGGETAAIGYTMIASALACGVEPVEWLSDVLERIVTCPPDRLDELLPDRWKAARPPKTSAAPATCAAPSAVATPPAATCAPDSTSTDATRQRDAGGEVATADEISDKSAQADPPVSVSTPPTVPSAPDSTSTDATSQRETGGGVAKADVIAGKSAGADTPSTESTGRSGSNPHAERSAADAMSHGATGARGPP
jgi:transposase